jgi:hypothetical protein
MHYVFKMSAGEQYVGVRKDVSSTSKRPSVTGYLHDARVFNTKAAATNAGKAAGYEGKAVPVTVTLQAAA